MGSNVCSSSMFYFFVPTPVRLLLLKGLRGVLCVCFPTHQMNESCSCEPCAYEDGTQVHQLDGITVRDESYITPLKVKHIVLAYR